MVSYFSHIKISQQEPQKGNVNFYGSWEAFPNGMFPINRKFSLFMKAPQKQNKIFYSPLYMNTDFTEVQGP